MSWWMQKTTIWSAPLRHGHVVQLMRRIFCSSEDWLTTSCESCKPPNSEKIVEGRCPSQWDISCHGLAMAWRHSHAPEGVPGSWHLWLRQNAKLCNVQLKWQTGIGFEPVWKKNWWQFHPQQVQNPKLARLGARIETQGHGRSCHSHRSYGFLCRFEGSCHKFYARCHPACTSWPRHKMLCSIVVCNAAKVSSRQLSHRQCQTSADVLKEAISSTSKQKKLHASLW